MSFKGSYFAVALTLILGAALWFFTDVAVSQMPVPADISYETKPMANVIFSHKFHVTEKKLQCPECHTKIFQMKKGAASPEMTMAKLNEGQFCGTCHNAKKAFSTKDPKECTKCHVNK